MDEKQPEDVADAVKLPRIGPAIHWLENGCNVSDAITELRIYERQIEEARAILALRPVQVPMTREEILAMVDDYTFFGTAEEIVRAIEAHHGIKPKEQA